MDAKGYDKEQPVSHLLRYAFLCSLILTLLISLLLFFYPYRQEQYIPVTFEAIFSNIPIAIAETTFKEGTLLYPSYDFSSNATIDTVQVITTSTPQHSTIIATITAFVKVTNNGFLYDTFVLKEKTTIPFLINGGFFQGTILKIKD